MTDLFYFRYSYGNGDFYSGYGYANPGTYHAGQYVAAGANETGYSGSYYISSVSSGYTDSAGEIFVNSYYDADTGYGYAYSVSSSGSSGLGSESGSAYNSRLSNGDSYFSNYTEADLYYDLYYFTYHYGNGDLYSGYGYANPGTYYTGQSITVNTNETGYNGYYYINSASSSYSGIDGNVTVNSYYDADTGYGYAYSVSGSGSSGLGSESGSAYNSRLSNGDSYFSNYTEADLYYNLYYFTYYYGNGDLYSGYGYANPGTYYTGQSITVNTNETGYNGYYYINSASSSYSGIDGNVTVNSYYDADTGYGYAYSASGSGSSGLKSESGYAYNSSLSNTKSYFSDYSEADLL